MPTIKEIYFKDNKEWRQFETVDLGGLGLKGDKRDLSFISHRASERLTKDRNKGFCHMRFRANLVIDSIDINSLALGQLLQIGEVIVKITEIEKECLANCPIMKISNKTCGVNRQIFFGEVLQAGIIKEKDRIAFIQKK